jgi:redox-sensitive bicupin YhaK (pirin superfamily)
MSGPVTTRDASPVCAADRSEPPTVEVTASRTAQVGDMVVRRALPRRSRRTVGAWCFVDHLGPAAVTEDEGIDIGPHPHIGLQTVTWLLAGEILHRDSLGSEQVIRPGQLNLMTAGHGVAHAEEHTGRYRGDLHGVQLWVAQPEATRHGPPAFEHHANLPQAVLGDAHATVLVGRFVECDESPVRRDTEHIGVDLVLRPGATTLPLSPEFEHALVVLHGAVEIDGQAAVEPGRLAYLGTGRGEVRLRATGQPARTLLLGGVPFPEPVLMWWNFVARTRDEITEAHGDWTNDRHERFGPVASPLPRIPVGPPPWAPAPNPSGG